MAIFFTTNIRTKTSKKSPVFRINRISSEVFMPKIPVISVIGRSIEVIIVSLSITLFVRVVKRESLVSRKSSRISFPTSRVFLTRLYSEETVPRR